MFRARTDVPVDASTKKLKISPYKQPSQGITTKNINKLLTGMRPAHREALLDVHCRLELMEAS